MHSAAIITDVSVSVEPPFQFAESSHLLRYITFLHQKKQKYLVKKRNNHYVLYGVSVKFV